MEAGDSEQRVLRHQHSSLRKRVVGGRESDRGPCFVTSSANPTVFPPPETIGDVTFEAGVSYIGTPRTPFPVRGKCPSPLMP